MKQLVKMSLEDFPKFIEDEDPSLAIADTCFLSTRPNSHGFIITSDVLRRDAHTILGKFLIGNMNWMGTDTKGHEQKPQIFGYFPTDQEIRFVEKDGYLLAYAYVVISKIYATDYYEIFKRDNFRNTSVEMLCAYSEQNENLVEAFRIEGLTSLAKNINGSCPDANIEVVRFSESVANEYYKKTKSIWDNKTKGEVLMSKTKEKEDIVMEEQKDEKLEQPTKEEEKAEEKCSEETMSEEKTEEPTSEEDEEKMAEPQEEEPKEEKASEEEVKAGCGGKEKMEEPEDIEDDEKDDEKEDDEKEDSKEKMAEERLSEMESLISEQKSTIEKLEQKIEELTKFKEEKEELEKMSIVTATLAQVKDRMPEEDYAKFEKSGKECKFEEVNAWKNEVLANVATILMSVSTEDGITRMGLPTEVVEKRKRLWD